MYIILVLYYPKIVLSMYCIVLSYINVLYYSDIEYKSHYVQGVPINMGIQ